MTVAAVVNPAFGAELRHGVTVSMTTTYTKIAQVLDIDGPDRQVGTRDTTFLDSTAETCAATLVKNGELSGQLLYDPQSDSHQILEGLIATPVSDVKWQLKLGDTTNGTSLLTFLGVLTKFAPTGIKREENLLANYTIKVSGAVVLSAGS